MGLLCLSRPFLYPTNVRNFRLFTIIAFYLLQDLTKVKSVKTERGPFSSTWRVSECSIL